MRNQPVRSALFEASKTSSPLQRLELEREILLFLEGDCCLQHAFPTAFQAQTPRLTKPSRGFRHFGGLVYGRQIRAGV
jgi:hypothetical protein